MSTDRSEPTFEPSADELVAHNRSYAAGFDESGLDAAPARRLAVVACMDARLDVMALLGLRNGEAHVLRNGGGVVTDDTIRSLSLSQRALGTREIVLVQHTDCGLQKVTEESFAAELQADIGFAPPWRVESFGDPHASVRQSIRRLRASPFLPVTDAIRGFVYDVDTGLLEEVDPGDDSAAGAGTA